MSTNILNNSDINKNIVNNNIDFLVDKYVPNDIDDIFDPNIEGIDELKDVYESNSWEMNLDPKKCFFHKNIFKKLKKISEDDGMPHIIFYGNPGSGKKTMINLFLEMIFDKSIYKLDNSKYTVISSGNIENEVIVEDHLFRFNPYKDYLTIINKQEEFKKIAHENFQKEIIKFGNTINF